jgi:hypothetical protein
MSSPAGVLAHDLDMDTPVSQGSPLNVCSSPQSSIPKLITPCKESDTLRIDTEASSPKTNGGSTVSGNSSPESSTGSPLRLASPANGILTPPTDGDNCSDNVKLEKPGGRLKFYKRKVLHISKKNYLLNYYVFI